MSDLATALRGDKVNNVRFESARALRKIADPSVGPQLVELISYGDAKVRNEVVYTIGRLRYAAAVPQLSAQYDKELALTGHSVDRVFRDLLLARSRSLAIPCRRTSSCARSQMSIRRLRSMPTMAPPPHRCVDAQRHLHRLSPDEGREILDAQAWALYRMGRKEFLTAVVDGLGDRRTNKESREYLLELTNDQVPDLFPFVTHKDVNVREGLAEILGLIGDDRAVPALQDLSRDKSGEVADLASQALHRIGARKGA